MVGWGWWYWWWLWGLKGAEIRSKMCSELFIPSLPHVMNWKKHRNEPSYPHMTGSRITTGCQVKGGFIIKAAGSVAMPDVTDIGVTPRNFKRV